MRSGIPSVQPQLADVAGFRRYNETGWDVSGGETNHGYGDGAKPITMGSHLLELRTDCDCLCPETAAQLCGFTGVLHTCPETEASAWLVAAARALNALMHTQSSCWLMDANIDEATGHWRPNAYGMTCEPGSPTWLAVREQLQSGFPADDARGPKVRAFGLPLEICLARNQMYHNGEWDRSSYRAVCERVGVHDFVRCVRVLKGASQRRWLVAELCSLDACRPCAPEKPALLGALTDAVVCAYDHRFLRLERARAALMARVSPAAHAVLPLLADGFSESEIGKQIFRSVHTVHDHVKQIYKALDISSRIELRDLWMGTSQPTPDRPGSAVPSRTHGIE
ncbi:MAG: helix-turn-helix transcriptional regulator [Phycisphaerales bacterium]